MRSMSVSNHPVFLIRPRSRGNSLGYRELEHHEVLEFPPLQVPGGSSITVRQFR
jgi:hypothetical protein